MDNKVFTNKFICKKKDGTTAEITIKQFPPNCPKINYNNQCSSLFAAWLPAITVCRQALFA